MHYEWNPDTFENDILLLKLDSPVVDKPIVPINRNSTLPAQDAPLTVIGLGARDARAEEYSTGAAIPIDIDGSEIPIDIMTRSEFFDREQGDILQEVEINAIGDNECNGEDMYRGRLMTDVMLCAGLVEGGRDACIGDSGGPLLQKNDDGSMVQVGIVSFGSGCARANRPGVYTRLSSFAHWIDQRICELSDNPPRSCTVSDAIAEAVPAPIATLRSQLPTSRPVQPPSPLPSPRPSAGPSMDPTAMPSGSRRRNFRRRFPLFFDGMP